MWDWRLVASLIYEESNFKPGLTSTRNASGLMQLMPATAAKFGIEAGATPARQIAGGVKYLRYIDKQLPDDITSPVERIYFVLACYNVGIGRVMVARTKAEKFGKDKKSYTFRIVYRSPERTLTNEEINVIQEKIREKTKLDLKAVLR